MKSVSIDYSSGGVRLARPVMRFNYTEWRRYGLPDYPLDELAKLANLEAENTRTS